MTRNRLTLLALTLAALLAPSAAARAQEPRQATAVFAGGCFWCLESDMDKVKGVLSTTSGYTGGKVANPTYEQVSGGGTGHTEAVKVVYDPSVVSYRDLLHVFWRNVDPLTANAQFCDKGSQYRSEIFYGSPQEKKLAEDSKTELQKRFDKPIATIIAPASTFYPAEDYHQDYYKKNSLKYKFYRLSCGRDRRLEEVWGKEAGAHS